MSEILPFVVSGLFVLGAAVITYRGAIRSARISREATAVLEESRSIVAAGQVKVDELKVAREAYETANRITGGLLSGLTREVGRLNVRCSELESSNRKLEQTARDLIDVLHEHNIPIPQTRPYQ